MAPMKTPVSLPRNDNGSIPPYSSASHATSSNNRCCGSVATASRGLNPKNPASNNPAPSTNPPRPTNDEPHPRSTGKSPVPSTPPETKSHNPPGDTTPAGKRHPIPTRTTGSSSTMDNDVTDAGR